MELCIFHEGASNIRVLHWNVLAQQLCSKDAFPKVDSRVTDWNHRAELFKQEFFKVNFEGTYEWDVICLQECDRHCELFDEQSQFKGGKFANGDKWAVAIYYNSQKFEEISVQTGRYTDPKNGKEQSQQYMIRNLREKESGIEFAVFTTHLKAKKGFEAVRESQVDQIIDLCLQAGE